MQFGIIVTLGGFGGFQVKRSEVMIQETIAKIRSKIENAESIKLDNKAELLNLLTELKTEITKLSQTHGEEAMSITGFAGVSAHEATRQDRNPQLLQLSLDGLSSSAKGF